MKPDDGPSPRDILIAHAGERLALTLLSELAAYGYSIVERKSFFDRLSPSQQKAALEHRGPENHGDSDFPKEPNVDD